LKPHRVFFEYFTHLAGLAGRLVLAGWVAGLPMVAFLMWRHPSAAGGEVAVAAIVPMAIVLSLVQIMVYRGIITPESLKPDPDVRPEPPAQQAGALAICFGAVFALSTFIYLAIGPLWAASDSALLGFGLIFLGAIPLESRARQQKSLVAQKPVGIVYMIRRAAPSRIGRAVFMPFFRTA